MRQLDDRFLAVHPATSLWWEQREQCETCKHLRLKQGDGNEAVMRCAVAKHPNQLIRQMLAARTTADLRPYCIDSRSKTGSCGPDASLYEPR